MAYLSAKNAYQQVEVTTLSPQRLVVLLYTHLVSNLRIARHHIEQREIAQRTERLLKAFDIVQELQVSLDHEVGGPIAANLSRLYAFWMQEILRINRESDLAGLDRLIAMTAELHGAWAQAAEQVAAEQTAVPAAARIA